jgi:hypothetical protein
MATVLEEFKTEEQRSFLGKNNQCKGYSQSLSRK